MLHPGFRLVDTSRIGPDNPCPPRFSGNVEQEIPVAVSTRPEFERRRRWAAVVGLALACTAGGVGSRADEPAPATEFFLDGLDRAAPSQETFKGWPPAELVERHYWLPWGAAALGRAALFDRPIFFLLDVGWSRSAAETLAGALSDPRVIAAINSGFVAVRVNADMRPDVRERYQTGTWPVIAFLLPDGRPMLSSANEQGQDLPITTGAVDAETLLFLVREGAKYWSLERDSLFERGAAWALTEGPPRPLFGVVGTGASDKFAEWLRVNADRTDGGFGAAPKFVLPSFVEYASLRRGRGVADLVEHASFSLRRLLDGPLFDWEQGGAYRIAAAPSFGGVEREKMLSTNTALLRELTFELRERPRPELRQALQLTARFVLQGLAREGGGFYLAQLPAPPGQAAGVDGTVLAGPNALAGAALLRAAALLEDPELERAGRAALDYVVGAALEPGGGVRHVLEPTPSTRTYLETLADTAAGFVDGYEATGDRRLLDAARAAADLALAELRDADSPALLDHPVDPRDVGLVSRPRRPMRPNVRLARAMIRMTHLGSGPSYRASALQILASFCGDLSGFRTHGIAAALALEEASAEPLLVRVVGPRDADATRALRFAALRSPWPWTVIESVEAAPPAFAELVRGGAQTRVADAAELEREIARASAPQEGP